MAQRKKLVTGNFYDKNVFLSSFIGVLIVNQIVALNISKANQNSYTEAK